MSRVVIYPQQGAGVRRGGEPSSNFKGKTNAANNEKFLLLYF